MCKWYSSKIEIMEWLTENRNFNCFSAIAHGGFNASKHNWKSEWQNIDKEYLLNKHAACQNQLLRHSFRITENQTVPDEAVGPQQN